VLLLTVLARNNPAIVSREETLELFTAFEAAYRPLAEDQVSTAATIRVSPVKTAPCPQLPSPSPFRVAR
jgi:hypothetical protein